MTTEAAAHAPTMTTVAGATAAVWPDDVPLTDGGDALIGAAWGGGASVGA